MPAEKGLAVVPAASMPEMPVITTSAIEKVFLQGDLSSLKPDERVSYYHSVCKSIGLNPLTRPFDYLNLNGKLILYARRECTEQLRQLHNVSIHIKERTVLDGCFVVTASAKLSNGREDESIGAVSIDGLKGETRSNAMMKAETKAKRRVTLSICGLAFLDESEAPSTGGQFVNVDMSTGEVAPAADTRRQATPEPKTMASPITHRVIPEQMQSTVADMMQRPSAIAPAFSAMERAMVERGGEKGRSEYERCLSEFTVSVPPRGHGRKPDHYVECLLDIWEAYEALEQPMPEAPAEFAAEETDVPF